MGHRNRVPERKKAAVPAPGDLPRKRGRPPDARKRRAILQAAQRLFFGADPRRLNIETIARRAGVSKATVYAQFDSLEAIIGAVIQDHRQHMLRALETLPATGQDLRASLVAFGERLVDFLTSPRGVALQRMVATDFGGRRGMGRLIFREGPAALRDRLTEIVRAAEKAGAMRVHDAAAAAEQLLGMWHGILVPGLLMSGCRRPAREERRRRVRAAVDAWLRAYGV